MNHHRFSGSFIRFSRLGFLICSVFTAVAAAESPTPANPPNILLIVSEDNGPELGCYGDPYARTPVLDQLAAHGLRCNRAYVPQAGCSQSRASLLTGLYPHQHGQIGLATWGFRMFRDDFPNLPRTLRAAGYRTGIIGKLHINPESAFPFDFTRISNANFQRRNLADYAKFADEFFRGDGGAGGCSRRPFFLSVNYPEAHDPFLRQVDGLPTEPLDGANVRALPAMAADPPGLREIVADYYNCIARLDSLVGRLLEVLEASGHADNTLVIYLGDHGADLLRGKRTCFDGGLRVPLLMRWPGRIQPQVREELVSTLDVFPTVLSAAGISLPEGLPGRPLQPFFTNTSAEWRTHVFSEYHTHAAANYFPQRSVRSHRFRLIENLLHGEVHPDYDLTLKKLEKEAVRRRIPGGLDLAAEIAAAPLTVREAYQRMRQPPQYELHDLEADPQELRNLAEDSAYASELQSLRAVLAEWRAATFDPLLDPRNLSRLTAEVRSVRSKGEAREVEWGYTDYLHKGKPLTEGGKAP